jgi:putative membrane protein
MLNGVPRIGLDCHSATRSTASYQNDDLGTHHLSFIFSHLTYHHFHGDTKFLGQGWIRPIYFFILISHIILSVINLPMILTTLYYALDKRLSEHKKLARWTLPIWIYVSVTGVLVYAILNHWPV